MRTESFVPGPSGKGRGRGLPGVAMECNKEKGAAADRLILCWDVFLSRGIPGSTGMMIFKYCTRSKIIYCTDLFRYKQLKALLIAVVTSAAYQ